jgi:hypothetical protein
MGGYDDDRKQITRPNPVILGLDVKAAMRKIKAPTPPPIIRTSLKIIKQRELPPWIDDLPMPFEE